MLNELLNKISSYNIFNYLLPGAVFAFLFETITGKKVAPSDLLTIAFVYYFIGLVISRVGSIIIEPLLKNLKVIKFLPYSDYISASSQDRKLEIFVEVANMYRTLTSMCLLLLLVAIIELFTLKNNVDQDTVQIIFYSSLVLLFVFSYIKQSNFIKERIKKANQ